MAAFPALFGLILAISLVSGQFVDISPRQAVRRVGDDLEVLCKVPYAIDSCRITVGATTYRLKPGDKDEVVYHGQGLEAGECGAYIKNIREEWNGNITCILPPQTGSIEISASMQLLIAKPPLQPTLVSPPQPSFKQGDVFVAQCIAADGRPAAKLSWLIDDQELLEGVHQPVLTTAPGTDLTTISQNITKPLTADDNGRTITCRVEHEALATPYDVRRQLVVNYPPTRPESGPITIFGLKLNEEGRLNVTLRSNPAPRAEWTVGDIRLVAPGQHDDGTIRALEPMHLGGGYYNITLVLSHVTKEEVDRTYYLSVSNDLGRDEIPIRISTMDEPAGVELETGAIVGIVIAVLVLLIAVFLAVFAFATDRWCFASRRRENTKSSGESTPAGDVLLESGNTVKNSDTESAVGGKERSRLAALGARMRAALPRPRDKVQATEPNVEEDKEPEDKVVYAQLALSEQTSKEKPPSPSTEYAEIVYQGQGQKDAKET